MKKCFSFIFVFCLFVLSCTNTEDMPEESVVASSEIRSFEEALQIAQNSIVMLENQSATRAISKKRNISLADCKVVKQKTTRSYANSIDTLMYVFNFEDNSGFAIVAAPKCIDGLLAITEKGYFDPDTPSEIDGFNAFIEKAKEYCLNAYSEQEETSDNARLTRSPVGSTDEWKDSVWYEWTYVWPLISVRWGQSHPEGEFCPNGHAGCSNTAMAQILTYYEHPDTIQLTYWDADKNYEVLNWANMKSHSTGHTLDLCSTQDVHTSISRLLRELGELCHSQYNTNSTSTYTSVYAPIAFSNLGYSVSEWYDYNLTTALTSLDVLRPLLLVGWTYDSIGHVWVLDGYQKRERYEQTMRRINNSQWFPVGDLHITTTYFMHYNWGWYGVCNGYYYANVFNTSSVFFPDTNQNYANYNFKYNVEMMSVYR